MGLRHGLAGMLVLGLAIVPQVARAAPVKAEQAALRTAYLDLIQGDHDYKGHRMQALKQVEAACKLLGLNVTGDGDAKQQQVRSDNMLRDALIQLQAVRGAAASNGQTALQKYCDEGIKQIQQALAVK